MRPAKKVLILTSVHRPFDTRIYKREAISLAEAGYEVSLVATDTASQRTAVGINLIGIPKPIGRLGRIFNWPRFVKIALAHKADFVHFHDPDLLLAGVVIKLLTGKPVIYDCHEPYREALEERNWLPKWIRSVAGFTFEWLEKNLSKWFFTVVVATSGQQQLHFPKATVIRNFPELGIFDLQKQPAENSKLIVHIGESSVARGITDIIEACRWINRADFKVVLAGKFDDVKTERAVKQRIARYGLDERVQCVGVLPYEQMLALLSQAAIGLVLYRETPALRLSIPTKLFEYMACALPVVATNLPSITPFIEETECGLLVPPEDPKALALAITYLLDHPDEARRIGENGRRAVIEKYNWDSEARKLLELYEMLLAEKNDK